MILSHDNIFSVYAKNTRANLTSKHEDHMYIQNVVASGCMEYRYGISEMYYGDLLGVIYISWSYQRKLRPWVIGFSLFLGIRCHSKPQAMGQWGPATTLDLWARADFCPRLACLCVSTREVCIYTWEDVAAREWIWSSGPLRMLSLPIRPYLSVHYPNSTRWRNSR